MRLPFRHLMRQNPETQVRQVLLPSGRAIEIVYLDGRAAALGDLHEAVDLDEAHAEAAQDLTTCGGCGCPFVQPIDWDEAGSRHWRVTLRCPNCLESGTVVVEDEVVDHYDLELERGAAELARMLHEIVEENIEREAERLREALDGGHLLPEDF
jgi:hypothetical protein